MNIDNIIDQIREWFDEDDTHTSAVVICTSRDKNDPDQPFFSTLVCGNKNDSMKAIAATAYENPDFEELLTRVLSINQILHQQDKAQDRKEAHYAS